jgi:GNAT superfamily N-acetyltransferase
MSEADTLSFSPGVYPIEPGHELETFRCGVPPLDDYLRKFALTNRKNGAARAYVALRGNRVVGYFTLAVGSIGHAKAPARISQGLARHPVPVLLLARLATDVREQGAGLGKALLKQAMLKAVQAADIAGIRAILTHAKDEKAKAFYQRFGFEPSPTDDLHLCILMKDVRKALTI